MSTVMSKGSGVWNVPDKKTNNIFGELNYKLGRGKENNYSADIAKINFYIMSLYILTIGCM